VSEKTIDRLAARGELVRYLDGGHVKITKASVTARRVRLISEANPATGPKPKVRPFWGRRPTKADREALKPRRRAAVEP
jgi:hypothetical protein